MGLFVGFLLIWVGILPIILINALFSPRFRASFKFLNVPFIACESQYLETLLANNKMRLVDMAMLVVTLRNGRPVMHPLLSINIKFFYPKQLPL